MDGRVVCWNWNPLPKPVLPVPMCSVPCDALSCPFNSNHRTSVGTHPAILSLGLHLASQPVCIHSAGSFSRGHDNENRPQIQPQRWLLARWSSETRDSPGNTDKTHITYNNISIKFLGLAILGRWIAPTLTANSTCQRAAIPSFSHIHQRLTLASFYFSKA